MIRFKNMPAPFRKKKIEEQIAQICDQNDIVFMAMFGSFVRDEQNKKSDVDIAVEFKKNSRTSLFDLVRIEDEMKKVFKRRVDLGTLRSLNPLILDQVKKEMKIIYEKG